MRDTRTSEEQTEVVVNFGDDALCRARDMAGSLLVDGNGWGKPLDIVYIRFIHLAEELTGVGRE